MRKPIYPGWWQVATVLTVQAVCSASIFTGYSIIAVALKAEFQPSNAQLMMGVMVVSMLSGVLSPVIGRAFDNFSIRLLMALGGGFLGGGFLLLSFTSSMLQVVAVYAVFMSMATILLGPIAASALLARWFDRRRGMAMGIAASGGALGGLLIPPLLQWLLQGMEWRMALRLYALITFLLTSPLILFLISNRPQDRNITPEPPGRQQPVISPQASITTKTLLSQPRFWITSVVLGSLFAGPMGVVSNMVQFSGTKGITAAKAALLLSVISGANFAGKLIVASISDRISLKLALSTMLVAMSLAMLGLWQLNQYAGIMAMVTLAGLAGGGTLPLWSLLISRLYGPAQIGKVMGAMSFVIMPFSMLAPPTFGWVYDQHQQYNVALIGVMALLVTALALLSQIATENQPAAAAKPMNS
ncbi:MFS transporter [Halioxenophilus aromaticivorans]|uniref:MFS transporter n=1 Tax=Halioxenophilus aromaticivorans TaxID=1306992 RepID=A0AAV3U2W0_9ALTE